MGFLSFVTDWYIRSFELFCRRLAYIFDDPLYSLEIKLFFLSLEAEEELSGLVLGLSVNLDM